jgi:hypothetical protein
MAEIGAPVPAEEYDHTVPKPKHGGLPILESLLFLGGGQLVKNHFRRLFGRLWAHLDLFAVGRSSEAVTAPSIPPLKLSVSRRRPPAG